MAEWKNGSGARCAGERADIHQRRIGHCEVGEVQVAMRAGLAYFALAQSLAAQGLANPEHFWRQESAYSGAQACSACHANIAKKQEASAHARSLRPPAEIPEITSRLPFELADKTSGATLRIERAGAGLDLVSRKSGSEDRLSFRWAFGSGLKGITPVGLLSNGQLAESRLTWYRSIESFDITTGAAKFDPQSLSENLGRPLQSDDLAQCFGCHSTGEIPQAGLPRNGMGIRCERCHGPGQEHIRNMQQARVSDKRIFHPGKIDGFAQAQLCGVCHGRPPEDTDLAMIRLIQQAPNTVRFPSQRLVLSRCFNESAGGIRCTACHDPHTDGVRGPNAGDSVCSGCHQKGSRARVKTCPVAKANCASCHMVKEQVMAHSSFTDHWIRVVRSARL
jgi:hypothetical protein